MALALSLPRSLACLSFLRDPPIQASILTGSTFDWLHSTPAVSSLKQMQDCLTTVEISCCTTRAEALSRLYNKATCRSYVGMLKI